MICYKLTSNFPICFLFSYFCKVAGIYIHIPFCRRRCNYCDFHFSTSLSGIDPMVEAICAEIKLRKDELHEPIETIYFGGGTPSLLDKKSLELIFDHIHQNYTVVPYAEITLEANPDDLNLEKLKQFETLPINRLSIGVQSFFDIDLNWMNRIHTSSEAKRSIQNAQNHGFENISIDLIYGSPTTTDQNWMMNLQMAIELGIPHISSYALTVESRTPLAKQIIQGRMENIDETKQEMQFAILTHTLTSNSFIHYEISNFAKSGFFSQHNSNYWKGVPYLGIGPSAHSYDGKMRSWNVPNNSIYVKNMSLGQLPSEKEILSEKDKFNEYVMIGLRTNSGLSTEKLETEFETKFYDHFYLELNQLIQEKLIQKINGSIRLTEKGKFLADGISARLFYSE